jgi:multidrug efflux pump subunit AcrB
MATIPFGVVGAIAGHALLDLNLTLFSIFGLVALTGVVVNDAIVMIDYINNRLEHGLPIKEALLEAGCRRVRPVMLTSVTTIAGLLPIVMETSLQAQIVIPMAVSLCFGLMFTTILVLYFVPTFYLVYWRFTGLFLSREPDEPSVQEPEVAALEEEPGEESAYVGDLEDSFETVPR